MTSGIHDLRLVRQLERSIQLAPIKRATGLSMAEIEARIMRGRDERKRRHIREVDLARARNESDQCADCGAQLGIRVRLAWDPHTYIIRCLDCGAKR